MSYDRQRAADFALALGRTPRPRLATRVRTPSPPSRELPRIGYSRHVTQRLAMAGLVRRSRNYSNAAAKESSNVISDRSTPAARSLLRARFPTVRGAHNQYCGEAGASLGAVRRFFIHSLQRN